MSTHIVDKIEAVRLSQEATGHYGKHFPRHGVGRRQQRPRHARAAGTRLGHDLHRPEWQVIGDCCRFAAGCSGGMTKLRGRQTKPEAYIRAYARPWSMPPMACKGPPAGTSISPRGFALPATTRTPPITWRKRSRPERRPAKSCASTKRWTWWTSTCTTRPICHCGCTAGTVAAGTTPKSAGRAGFDST